MLRRLLFVTALALLGGCFSPDKPVCSYSCASTQPACPDDYECRADGYCHLVGTEDQSCGFTAPPDMAMTLPSTDMSGAPSDMAQSD